MATFLRKSYNATASFFNSEFIADPRTKHLFLVDSIWVTPVLAFFYLYFTTSLGPKIMEKRQPFQLTRIIQIYNFIQIISNIYIFYLAIKITSEYNFLCEPIDYSNTPRPTQIALSVWYYFINKLMDLLDTVFIILRKKQTQTSFLHTYHHFSMAAASWICIKYFAGGQAVILGLLNSFVHTIMYTYYLLSSMKIGMGSWKKHITQLQILQFFLLALSFSGVLWKNCGFPRWIVIIIIPNDILMMLLFAEFYYYSYVKKPGCEKISMKIETNGVKVATNGKSKVQ